jgi:DNA polymerase-3 subunit delta
MLLDSILPDKSSRDLNLTVLYGTENSLSEILSTALSYPMLADRKLIVVRDFDKMKISDSESLEKYLNNLQSTSCIVLSASEKGKSKIYRIIENAAHNVECKPIPEYKVAGWLTSYCNQKGIKIDPEAMEFLINQVGSNLLALNQELIKVADFKNETTAITIEDIEQTTGASKEISVFALQKALSHRQLSTSLKISKQLIDSGQNINFITAILFSHFRKLIIADSLRQKGKTSQQIADDMHISSFQLKGIFETLKSFNHKQIKGIVEELHNFDVDSKTSAVSDGPGLQMLCYKICRI